MSGLCVCGHDHVASEGFYRGSLFTDCHRAQVHGQGREAEDGPRVCDCDFYRPAEPDNRTDERDE